MAARLSTPAELRRLSRAVERLHAAQSERDALLRVELAAALRKQDELSQANGELRADHERMALERQTLQRWLLNQKRETDKWRTAYAELARSVHSTDGCRISATWTAPQRAKP